MILAITVPSVLCRTFQFREPNKIAVGMAEKAKEFVDKGSEIYQGNLSEGVDLDHH